MNSLAVELPADPLLALRHLHGRGLISDDASRTDRDAVTVASQQNVVCAERRAKLLVAWEAAWVLRRDQFNYNYSIGGRTVDPRFVFVQAILILGLIVLMGVLARLRLWPDSDLDPSLLNILTVPWSLALIAAAVGIGASLKRIRRLSAARATHNRRRSKLLAALRGG